MTPKEKAEELCNLYFTIMQESSFVNNIEATKKCTLIAVDEILKQVVKSSPNGRFWQEVKQEIENL